MKTLLKTEQHEGMLLFQRDDSACPKWPDRFTKTTDFDRDPSISYLNNLKASHDVMCRSTETADQDAPSHSQKSENLTSHALTESDPDSAISPPHSHCTDFIAQVLIISKYGSPM